VRLPSRESGCPAGRDAAYQALVKSAGSSSQREIDFTRFTDGVFTRFAKGEGRTVMQQLYARPLMYAVIRQYGSVRGSIDEIVQTDRDGFVPLIRMEPGFVSYWIAADETGALRSVTIFETESGVDDSTQKSAAFVKNELASQLPDPPRITKGRLTVFERNQDLPLKFTVMRRLQVPDRALIAVTTKIRQGLLPLLAEGVPGFASHAAIDAHDGTVVIINGYTDRADRDRGLQIVSDWLSKNIANIAPGQAEIFKAEVKLFVSFLAVTTA
jgi:hypothetical protein